jgi:hypothetical protein
MATCEPTKARRWPYQRGIAVPVLNLSRRARRLAKFIKSLKIQVRLHPRMEIAWAIHLHKWTRGSRSYSIRTAV